eukprot:3148945-Pleurochrysis_carterae.AAC.1
MGRLAPVRSPPRHSISRPLGPGLRLSRDRCAGVRVSAPAASLVGMPGDAHAPAWISSARPQCSPVCLRVPRTFRRAVGVPGDARTRVWMPRSRPQFARVRPLQPTPVRSSSLRFVQSTRRLAAEGQATRARGRAAAVCVRSACALCVPYA